MPWTLFAQTPTEPQGGAGVLAWLVAFLLSAVILLIVCAPSRKA